ncbi:hypothetical protein L6452_40663 [Arctium lappa]|uniref:Uncharacterized protein n=1 Tax=Arctium lappa TaxID=4217 RepID=A0ACB8XLZ2_ARCLA|nr:hypothetical protein L6452_40663 [Arctium lappa]
MGVAACISDIYDSCHFRHASRNKLKKTNQLQTVEIKVKMDCEGCERKVRKSVSGMKGVSSVDVDPKKSKLTVVGYVDPNKVLSRVRHHTGKKADLWPYVPGVYDKKAPPGYVRDTSAVVDPLAADLGRASSTEIKYMTVFSDENPTACMVM